MVTSLSSPRSINMVSLSCTVTCLSSKVEFPRMRSNQLQLWARSTCCNSSWPFLGWDLPARALGKVPEPWLPSEATSGSCQSFGPEMDSQTPKGPEKIRLLKERNMSPCTTTILLISLWYLWLKSFSIALEMEWSAEPDGFWREGGPIYEIDVLHIFYKSGVASLRT